MSVNREALLKAAQQFSSSSESEESLEGTKDRSPSRKRRKHDLKERRSKHSKQKHSKKHKRHKRSEHEKIQEFERRAAAIGAASIIPRLPASLGSLAAVGSGGPGDVAVLDTSGDPNNTMFESLQAGSVPRYNRIDPMNLVSSKARLSWQAQLLQPDADAGNTRTDRYYKGRHMMLERSRQAKRIHLSHLRPKAQHHAMAQVQPAAAASAANNSFSGSLVQQPPGALLRPPAVLLPPPPPPPPPAAAAGAPAETAVSRKLTIPAPAFIPLQPPVELVASAAGAGDARPSAAEGMSSRGSSSSKLDLDALVDQAGLSVDELVLHATRQWNIAIRERPQDEQLWLDFAAFQHAAAKLLQQRGRSDAADAATAEKQVSLLTKGLTHHPSSSALLLALLRSYAVIAPDAAALMDKWRSVLAREGGNWVLWREYLALKQANYASYTITSVQQTYQQALHALYMALLATRRKAAAAAAHKQQGTLTPQQQEQLSPAAAAAAAAASSTVMPLSAGEEGLELQLVQLLLALMRSELLAGHCEAAVAKIQALLEYHLFQPPMPPGGASALLRLFAAYWQSGSARIGEPSARGWAYWACWNAMGLQPPTAVQQQLQQEEEEEPEPAAEEPAGWSGWFDVTQQQQQQQQHDSADAGQRLQQLEPKHEQQKPSSDQPGSSQGDSGRSGSEEGELSAEQGSEVHSEDAEQQEEDLDEVELMLQLGVQLEEQLQAVEQQGLPGHILKRWVQEEASRSSSQWQPLHPSTCKQQQQQPGTAAAAEPSRIIGFDTVEPCLFPIRSLHALRRLVLGCMELLGAPMGQWCCSNCLTPLQQLSPGVLGGRLGPGVTPAGSSRTLAEPWVAPVVGSKQWSDASADAVGAPEAAAAAATVGPGVRAGVTSGAVLVCHQPWYQAGDERWEMLVSLLERLAAGGPCSSWPELSQALLLVHASRPSRAEVAALQESRGGGSSSSSGAAAADGGLDVLELQTTSLTLDGAAAAASSIPGGASNSSSSSSGSVWPSAQQLAAVRAAAKRLLSEQQDNLLLYDAYGCCEAAMGQIKTARKVLESALTLATATATTATGAAAAAAAAGPQATEAAAAAAAVPLLALHTAQLEFAAVGARGALERAHAALHACLAAEPYAAAAAKAAAATAGAPNHQQQQQGLLADKALAKARRGFQDRIPQLLASAGGALTTAAAATIAAAALYELTVGLRSGCAGKGIDSAAAMYKHVLAAVPEAVRAAAQHHEQLQCMYCQMLVAAATGAVHLLVPPPLGMAAAAAGAHGSGSSTSSALLAAAAAALGVAVRPARARSALTEALQLYPHSKTLLNLQVQLDHACYTLAGLRRQLAAMTELNPSPSLWGVVLQAESMRPGGIVRLRAMFERALAAPSALSWHQQQKVQQQRQQHAWAAAMAELSWQPGSQPPRQQQQQLQDERELRQQRLLQGASAASSAAVLLDIAVQVGYRGWGNCGELWLSYMQWELSQGRFESARKLFLRALHECPGFKALWLSGFRALCDSLQPRESSGLLNAMQDREVVVRADVYEVLLEEMAAQQQQQQQQ